MGYIRDAQGNIIGQTPEPYDVDASKVEESARVAAAVNVPAPSTVPAGWTPPGYDPRAGAAGAGNVPAPPPVTDGPNTARVTGAGGQPGEVFATASDADKAAAAAEIARRRAAAAAAGDTTTDGPPKIPVDRKPGAGGPGFVIPRMGYTPAHFAQQGAVYRGTPEQNQFIGNILGANADRIQAQGELSAAEMQNQQKLNSVADIEALKARKANQRQAVLDEMEAADMAEAHQAVRAAVDKHASLAAPDPAKYWGGLGFAGSVGMIIADSMERMGSRMQGAAPANLIEQGIERSLRQQEAAISKAKGDITEAQGLYAQMRQSGMDKEHAFQAAKARRMEDAAGLIESYQRQARLPQVKAQLATQAADLRERAGTVSLELSKNIMGQGMGQMVAASGGGLDYGAAERMLKMRKLSAEVQQEESKAAGGGEPLSHSDKKATLATINTLEQSKATLEEALKNVPTKHEMYWEGRGSLPAEKAAWLEKVRMAIGATEPGTKSEADMERYGKTMGYLPGHSQYDPEVTKKLLARSRDNINDAIAAEKAALTLGQVTGLTARFQQEKTRNTLQPKGR